MIRIKVLTLNIWDVGDALAQRNSRLVDGLRRIQPDIVCLQEVSRDPVTQQIRSELFAGPCGLEHHVFSGFGETDPQRAPFPREVEGLAILSRYPAVRQTTATLPYVEGDIPRQALMAEIAVEQHRILVVTAHLAYPPHFSKARLLQMQKTLEAIDHFAARNPVEATILAGDFNEESDGPALHALAESKQCFRDAHLACQPADAGKTFASQNPYVGPGFDPGLRIDFIFATPRLKPAACTVAFDLHDGLDYVSDHFGVLGEFTLE